jgi:hypothetical protein
MDLEWSVEARATMATDGDRNQCKILRMAQVPSSPEPRPTIRGPFESYAVREAPPIMNVAFCLHPDGTGFNFDLPSKQL